MAIIAINGYAGSGKDTVGKMLQYYASECSKKDGPHYRTYTQFILAGGGSDLRNFDHHYYTEWEIKKFAWKLKEIASMLTGISVYKFEDQEFKKTYLGPEWNQWSVVFKSTGERYGNFLTKKEAEQFEKKERQALLWSSTLKTEVKEFPMTVRDFLQKLGTDGLRDGLHTNVWVNALFADYIAEPDPAVAEFLKAEGLPASMNGGKLVYPNWIITDCRFPNEAEAVKSREGIIIRVNRTGVKATNAHPSETSLDDWDFDYVIDNDGSMEDLLEKVKTIYEKV